MRKQVNFEGVRIGFKNFEGKEGMYNRAGDRNFAIFLDDPELAQVLSDEGWNVKYPKEREFEEGHEDTRTPFLDVGVSFKGIPPKVVLIVNGEATQINEEEVSMLDWIEYEGGVVDLVIRPYNWEFNGRTGVKAYLKAIYVTMASDDFTSKYGI